MLSELTIGDEGVNAVWYKLRELINTIEAIDGHFYGFFKSTSELPIDGDNGYAYVKTNSANDYQIWICQNTKWTDTGLMKTVADYDGTLSDTSTNAVQNKVVKEAIDALSNTTKDSLAKKVDKTITVNGHALSDNVTVTKSDVELGNVDNTADTDKPVSKAQQVAINAKLDSSKIVVLSEDEWDSLKTKVEGTLYLIYTE